MRKKLALGLLLVLLVGLSAGQTLQNFEYSPEDGFDRSLTGGESLVQEINFSSGVDRPVPLAVEIGVEAEEHGMSSTGAEFDLSESSIRLEDYSLYDYWNVEGSSSDEGSDYPPEFEVLELDDPQEGVPGRIIAMEDACVTPSGEPLKADSDQDDKDGCDFENIPGVSSANLSVDNRVEYDRSEVEGNISNEPLPPASGIDNSTVVPVMNSSLSLEESSEIDPSDYDLVPARFSMEGSLSSFDQNYGLQGEKGVYRLPLKSLKISDGADVSLEIVMESSPRIRPDTFSFEFDVRSVPGFASESKNESVGEDGEAEVEVGTDSVTTSVDVSAEEGSNVSVESYDEVAVAPPRPDSEFVGGVGVEVTKDNEQVEASGNITVSYDQSVVDSNDLDEDSMDVYYFNESRGGWTGEGVEVVERDVEDNTVTAEADHFSTYAVFADQEEPTETGDNTVDGFDGPVEFAPPRDEEEEVNDSEPQDESDGEDDIQQNDTQEDDEDSSGDDGTGLEQGDDESTAGPQQDSGPENPTGPTGLFTGQSGNVVLGLMALLVAVLAVLQYVGRVDIRELGSYFEGWRRS